MSERSGRPASGAPRSRFLLGFLIAALVIAGGLSYLASPNPDGLDSVALHGCTVSETDAGEQLDGTCIAQNATESPTARSPLADYAVGGRDGTTGLAGVIGVLVTALLGVLLFRTLGRAGRAAGGPADPAADRSGTRRSTPRPGER
ncbi:MAG TPA: PDGLE domain-containing protein [Pseudonocardia sp.]|jgi:cobalt/nickel transport protein